MTRKQSSGETRRIGFIGGGAMAEALIGGLRGPDAADVDITVAEPDPARRKHLETKLGLTTTADNAEAVAGRDAVVIAVKPGVVGGVLESLADGMEPAALNHPLWISIAAGVTISAMERALGSGARIVRAMPNTPALVHCGATAFVGNARAKRTDRDLARQMFLSVGTAWEAPNEGLLDAVTGLSGSGPAYVFVFLEALADAGVRAGLPREAANALAAQTAYGAAKLVLETGRHPASLKDQVTSPGGTTIAGLERLEAGGFRAALYEAVQAATARSKELGQG